ncbi:beta-glucosidase [Anaerocolumna jejuensis DSM 15929]|uniref:beta-N-acetylhexosaminidase n=1 Tax=Anaerocolumna jejuensis DSM 15929 TaxID=1121322 RepID=A0A1M6YP19_9FIRM|nr:glycoside hydrolase family 3 N-terminal domain-containing protein [Anaerocolumna jejuensis]SHL19759.1 beta-glucosidase [Anaerocolumna jejuensis DSM 15929]
MDEQRNDIENFINEWISDYECNCSLVNHGSEKYVTLLNNMMIDLRDFKSCDGFIDMHIHSKYSDGEFNTDNLVFGAYFLGLRAISITDHLSFKAYQNIEKYNNLDLLIYPGTEIITELCGQKYHVLAYGESLLSEEFNRELQKLQYNWNLRFYHMIDKLNQMFGFKIDSSKLEKYIRNETFDVDDLLNMLIQEGYCNEDKNTILDSYFDNKTESKSSVYINSANNNKYLPNTLDLISLIKKYQGYPVLAHCKINNRNVNDIKSMITNGLYGIELYHPYLTINDRKKIFTFGIKHGLKFWGGSDYHGNKKENKLGIGSCENRLNIPFALYAKSVLKIEQVIISLGKIKIKNLSLIEKIALIMKPGYDLISFDSYSIKAMKEKNTYYSKINKDIVSNEEELINYTKCCINANCHPIVININQEGGRLNTIDWKADYLFNGNYVWGKIYKSEQVKVAFKLLAQELAALGITWNFAPVCDVLMTDNSSLGVRCFSDSEEAVEASIINFIMISQKNGVAATAKHFPGIGCTSVDVHTGIPIIKNIDKSHLNVFMAAINAGVESIMIANLIVSDLDKNTPAFMSYNIVTNLLRNELKYKGIIVTDNITMPIIKEHYPKIQEVAVNSFLAGADIILYDPDFSQESYGKKSPEEKIEDFVNIRERVFNALYQAVISGRISEERLNESVERIINFYNKYGIYNSDDLNVEKLEKIREKSKKNISVIAKSATNVTYNHNIIPINKKFLNHDVLFVVYDIPFGYRADSEWKQKIDFHNLIGNHYGTINEVHVSSKEQLNEKILTEYQIVVFVTYYSNFYVEQINILKKIINNKSKIIIIGTGDESELSMIKDLGVDAYISANNRHPSTMLEAFRLICRV